VNPPTPTAAMWRAVSGCTSRCGDLFGCPGISNGGAITPAGVSAFSGNISSTGSITASQDGIRIENLSTFTGNISNGGTIAGSAGVAHFNGVTLSVSTFIGTLTNTGTISGFVGIRAATTPGLGIFDSGVVNGIGGTAIQFGGGVNTLTLGSGFAINGNVLGSGNDVFQLGGSGTGAFDLSTIGAANQYRGFTTFNVVSGTWVVSNTFGQTQAWNVNGGTLAGTGNLSSVNVNNGGTLAPGLPGTAGGTLTITSNLVMTRPRNKALTTAGGEWRWRNGWSVLGKFEGEFAGHGAFYSGTGQIKYTW